MYNIRFKKKLDYATLNLTLSKRYLGFVVQDRRDTVHSNQTIRFDVFLVRMFVNFILKGVKDFLDVTLI